MAANITVVTEVPLPNFSDEQKKHVINIGHTLYLPDAKEQE